MSPLTDFISSIYAFAIIKLCPPLFKMPNPQSIDVLPKDAILYPEIISDGPEYTLAFDFIVVSVIAALFIFSVLLSAE